MHDVYLHPYVYAHHLLESYMAKVALVWHYMLFSVRLVALWAEVVVATHVALRFASWRLGHVRCQRSSPARWGRERGGRCFASAGSSSMAACVGQMLSQALVTRP